MSLRPGTGGATTKSNGNGAPLALPGPALVHDFCSRASHCISWVDQLWPVLTNNLQNDGPQIRIVPDAGCEPSGDVVIELVDEPPAIADVPGVRLMVQVLHAMKALDEACAALAASPDVARAALGVPSPARSDVEIHHGGPGAGPRAGAHPGTRRPATDDRECAVCFRPSSKLVAGMDRPCYHAWVRAGRPERDKWELERRQWLEEHLRAATDTLFERLKAPSADDLRRFVREISTTVP